MAIFTGPVLSQAAAVGGQQPPQWKGGNPTASQAETKAWVGKQEEENEVSMD